MSIIRWKADCVLDICEDVEDFETITENRHAGEEDDVEIIEGTCTHCMGEGAPEFVQLQFGDGSVTLGVDRSWFEVIKDE